MIFIGFVQPDVPMDKKFTVASSCNPVDVFVPVLAKLEQSLALLVQAGEEEIPVTTAFVTTVFV